MTDSRGDNPACMDFDLREVARRIAPVLKALSDENRLAILLAVAHRPHSVVELTEVVGISQTLVSHHLKALRDTGLVTAVPRGRQNLYSLCCETLTEPVRLLVALAATGPSQ